MNLSMPTDLVPPITPITVPRPVAGFTWARNGPPLVPSVYPAQSNSIWSRPNARVVARQVIGQLVLAG